MLVKPKLLFDDQVTFQNYFEKRFYLTLVSVIMSYQPDKTVLFYRCQQTAVGNRSEIIRYIESINPLMTNVSI